MENTTIAITRELKEQIMEFGNKGETYSEIIKKLLENAKKRQLHDLLMNEDNTIPAKETLENARKRWQK